jgi:hypothetical protein
MPALRFYVTPLVLAVAAFGQNNAADLTRAQAKEMLVKAAAQDSPAMKITLSQDQMRALESVPNPNATTKKPGLLDRIKHSGSPPQSLLNLEKIFTLLYPTDPTQSAAFIDGGLWCKPMGYGFGNGGFHPNGNLMYAQCEHYIAVDINDKNPGALLLLKTPVRWFVKEVTGISTSPNQKIVEFTWQTDLSSWPADFQTAVNQPLQTSKAMFTLFDDGWRFDRRSWSVTSGPTGEMH